MTYRLEERRLLGQHGHTVTAPAPEFATRDAALALFDAQLRADRDLYWLWRQPRYRLILLHPDSAARSADPDAADDTRPVPRAGLPGRVSRPSAAAPPTAPREAPPAPWSAGGARRPETPNRVGACALSGAQARVSVTGLPSTAGANAGKSDPTVEEEPRPGSGAPGGASTKSAAADRLDLSAAADGVSSSPSLDTPASTPGTCLSGVDVTPPIVDPLAALGPRLVEPAPESDPALRDIYVEMVWISTPRKGINRHRTTGWTMLDPTSCGRSTRTGELRYADDPWVVEHTTPCPRCWPGGA